MTPAEIWTVVISALAMTAQWFTNWQMNRKQRNEISFAPQFTSKKEFEDHKRETGERFTGMRSELMARLDNQDRIAATSRKSIYDKIDDTRKELQSKLDGTHEALETDIKNMPHQLAALLRNMGVIK